MKRRQVVSIAAVVLALGGAGAAACSSDDEPEAPKPKGDASVTPFPEDAQREDAEFDASDGATGPYCEGIDAAAVVFCKDFESAAGPLFGFDESFIGDGGAAPTVTDEGGIAHPSFVLDVSLTQPATDAGTEAGAGVFLTRTLPAGKAANAYLHHEVELDFRAVGLGSLAYAALTVLSFPTAAIKKHGFAIYDGTVFGRVAPKDFAVRDDESKWHHARIVVERPEGGSTSSFRVTIDIDGTLVDNIGGVDPGTSTAGIVRVGAFETSPSLGGSLRAQFDNIVVRRW